MFVKSVPIAAAAVAGAMLFTACGGDSGTSTSAAATEAKPGKAIKIGAISSITGPFPFPEFTQAAQAVFDQINATGGINGRKVEYLVEDDKATPAVAAQAARKLVDDEGVVMLAGGSSLLQCSVNAKYYVQKDVRDVNGGGADAGCFTTPNISPTNTGPFTGQAVDMFYATTEFKAKRLCTLLNSVPGFAPQYKRVIKSWEKQTGQKLALDVQSIQGTDDLAPYVLRAKRAGCDAVVFNGVAPQAVAMMKAVQTQKATDIKWLMLTPAYSTQVAEALKDAGEGMYVNSEYAPFTESSSPAVKDYLALMAEKGIEPSSFGQGGYVAATIAVATLRSIKGEVDRKSVGTALKGLKEFKTPLLGNPYSFGEAKAHAPNRSSKMMQLRGGEWKVLTPDFLTLPYGY